MINPSWHNDLVLLGGGHSHALALLMMAMRPDPTTRITLVSLDSHTPYSGMLPGLLAGHYTFAETHIDLRTLCKQLGVRFIAARATGVDTERRQLLLAGRPALPFDVLSIDIGSQPGLHAVPGAEAYATGVKPVHSFYQRWLALEDRFAASDDNEEFTVLLVGGGAGSVELALAMRHRSKHPRL